VAPRNYFDIADASSVSWNDVKRAYASNSHENRIETVDLKLLLSLRHFVSWSSFAERVASRTIAVEDIGPQFISWLCYHPTVSTSLWPNGCPSPTQVRETIHAIGQKINHDHVKVRPGLEVDSVTWQRLRSLDKNSTVLALLMAKRYGYEYNETSTSGLGLYIGRQANIRLEEPPGYDKDNAVFGFTPLGQWFYHLNGIQLNRIQRVRTDK
jgi:hypothetical protein